MATPTVPTAGLRDLRLLLVEDHPVNREVVLALLEPMAVAIETAGDGREAVARAASNRYDLILMDVQMPVMDGLDATRAIRSLPQHARTPIIAMTADASGDDRSRYRAVGMTDFLPKPFEPAALISVIVRWTSRASPSPAAEARPPMAIRPVSSEEAGIDLAHGMLIAHGKHERYRQLLNEFARESVKDARRLRGDFAAGQLAEARRTCHALRGAAALVGATRLQALVHRLERAAMDAAAGDTVLTLLDEIDAANAALTAYLADTPPPPEHAPIAVPRSEDDEATALSALSVLAELLFAGDMRSNQVLADAMGPIRAYLGEAADTLHRQISRYDYEGAAETLRQALAQRRR